MPSRSAAGKLAVVTGTTSGIGHARTTPTSTRAWAGTVDTPMQVPARSQPTAVFPSRDLFLHFEAERLLVPPKAPAHEVVAFLESKRAPRFQERRLGG